MQYLLGIAAVLFAVFVLSLVFALPLMWLWNWLMPEIFGLMEIGIWQSLGLLLLSSLLFGNYTSNNS